MQGKNDTARATIKKIIIVLFASNTKHNIKFTPNFAEKLIFY